MKTPRKTMIAGFAIPLLSILFFGVSLRQTARVPSPADWEAAAAIVRQGWQDGDVVAFMPQWAQGASPWLRGLRVDTGENHDWYELSKAARVWLISSMNGRGDLPPEGWTMIDSRLMDKVDVSTWTPPRDRTLAFDFRSGIDKAVVSRTRGKTTQFCSNFKKNRWFCGQEHPWLYVGQESRDIAGRVRDIIWAHAVDRAVVEALWREVPRGTTLVVHYGLTQRAAEAREGSETVFSVLIDGKQVFSDTLKNDRHGWFRREFKLPGDGTSSVAFRVQADDPQSRQLCFTADAWK